MTDLITAATGHVATALRVLDPVAPAPGAGAGSTHHTVDSLEGKRIGVVANGWASWIEIRAQLIEELSARYPGSSAGEWDVPLGSNAATDVLGEIADSSDLTVLGLANCGSCAVTTAANARVLLDLGTPVVAVATERFESLVRSLQPTLPLIVLPASLEQMDAGRLAEVAAGLWSEIAARITEPQA